MFHFHPFLFFILPDAKPKCWAVPCRPTSPGDGRKERVVSNRIIHSLMDGEAHASAARSWTSTPPCAADSRQDRTWWQSSHGQVDTASYRGNDNWWHQVGSLVTRETSRRTSLTAPLIKTSWGLDQECRKVHKIKVKQALTGQRMFREQETSPLEWPDPTPHQLQRWIIRFR